MADPAARDTPTILMLTDDQTEGYCDPVTGMCVWPGAAEA